MLSLLILLLKLEERRYGLFAVENGIAASLVSVDIGRPLVRVMFRSWWSPRSPRLSRMLQR